MLLYENKAEDFRIWPSQSFDFLPHLHHNIEILICLEGDFQVTCNYRTETLHRGDMMIAFSNDVHSYSRGNGSGRGIMIITNPQVLPLIAVKLQNRRYDNFLLNSAASQKSHDVSGGSSSRTVSDTAWEHAQDSPVLLAEAALAEYSGDCSREILTGCLYVLLGTALKKLPFTAEKPQLHTDTFSRVMEYLSAHYTEPVSLKKLARRFGVDPSYLSRMFSERLSYGFLKYLHMLRIEHAKNLLRSTDLKIYDILERSGFADQKTFNRVFLELEGMTPSEFRQEHFPPEKIEEAFEKAYN